MQLVAARRKELKGPVEALIAQAGNHNPKDLTATDYLAAFEKSAKYAQSTRYHWCCYFRAIAAFLHEDHGSPNLSKWLPRVVRPAPRAITITTEERNKVIEGAEPWLRCWLLLCSDLALRSTTAASICGADYDEARGEITFTTKFGNNQTLPVTEEIAKLFASAKGDSSTPYVHRLHRLGAVTVTHLRAAFRKLCKEKGINRRIIPHDLRRTTAVKTLELTKDIRMVQAVLGHRDLSSTLYYLDHRNTPVPRAMLELAKLNPTTEAIQ